MRQDIDIDQLMTETWLTVTMLKKGAVTLNGPALYNKCVKQVESVREALERIQLGRTGLLGLKAGKLSNSQESLTVSLGCYEGLQWSVLPPAEDRHYRFD